MISEKEEIFQESEGTKKIRRYLAVESSLLPALKDSSLLDAEVLDFRAALSAPLRSFETSHYCFILQEEYVHSYNDQIRKEIIEKSPFNVKFIIVSDAADPGTQFDSIPRDMISLILASDASLWSMEQAARTVFDNMEYFHERIHLLAELAQSYQEIRRLTRVGQSLASERDIDVLIGLILEQAKQIVSADSGSIYVTERPERNESPTHIRFKKSSLELQTGEFLLPINNHSIAGYVALHGEPLTIDDVYSLTGEEEYSFNSAFDQTHNYYSKSMLVIPMKNHREEVIGVIQLINRKKNANQELTVEDMKGGAVIPFSERDRELAMALAGQAAVALENSQLIADIRTLFDGFVHASVAAIEQRDPITSGHSFRVAELTMALASAVHHTTTGPYASVHYTPDEMREIRYAAILHDFGKVGVREEVLQK